MKSMGCLKSNNPSRIIGIDFSGAVTAGNKIWVATGQIIDDSLQIEECFRGKDLPQSSANRDICLSALRSFIADQGVCICGLDFPFGLPSYLVREATWEDFVLNFGSHYRSPEDFKDACNNATKYIELKRKTDEETRTPFSAYNLRIFRQTYFGIKDVLAPLVMDNVACVLPMQCPQEEKGWIAEVCPASTLKSLGLYEKYKGNSKKASDNRVKILKEIERKGLASVQNELWSMIIDDHNGDAIDSIISAVAASSVINNPTNSHMIVNENYVIEGYVYV